MAAQAFLDVLTGLCRFNADTAKAIVAQGIDSPEAFLESDAAELILTVKGWRKTYAGDPSIVFTMIGIQHLEAFTQWCKDTDRRGYVPESANFEEDDMTTMIARVIKYRRGRRYSASSEVQIHV